MTIPAAQWLYEYIDSALQASASTGMQNVMLALTALIGSFWLLNFTIRSLKWLTMGLDVIAQDIIAEILKMAFIASMAFNVGWYLSTIVPFVTDAPGWMTGKLSGQSGSQVNQIDAMVSNYVATLLDLLKGMAFNIWDVDVAAIATGALAILLYVVGGVPFLVACISTLLVMKAATTILLSLGPIFIAFCLFDATRQWFWGWVSQLAGFMLTQVMFSTVLALEIGFVNSKIIVNGHIDASIGGCFAMLIVFGVFLLLVVELPAYAAAIMGGSPAGSGIMSLASRATGLRTASMLTRLMRSKLPGKNNIS